MMGQHTITKSLLKEYEQYLTTEERSAGTIENYTRCVGEFGVWLGERELNKLTVTDWKAHLLRREYQSTTINAKLAALNSFLRYMNREDCAIKYVRVQRKMFREEARHLTRQEYSRLVGQARKAGKDQLALLMESICATGIRVSEVKYLTVEAARKGAAVISLKGKVRTILIPAELCRRLLRFGKKNKIASGELFRTRDGRSLSRKQIWAAMKKLCERAGVPESKVFPHNLRHLFAVAFYGACKDIARLADVLGHSSIETTRIYLLTTGEEQVRQLERLRLLC